MKNEPMSVSQVLMLVKNFTIILLSKTRSGKIAKKLISQKKKIESSARDFLSNPLGYNFFENKMFLSGWFADDDSCPEIEETNMTVDQALEISEIFGRVMCTNFCSETEAEKLIKDKDKLVSLADDLFEMSPAFNLFEYNRYVKHAPLSAFREVCTWDRSIFIVCTADEVCEPYGFKSGERVVSSNHALETIIGVAPFWFDKGAPLAIWTASDDNKFRDPTRVVVGAWKERDLKKIGFVSTTI